MVAECGIYPYNEICVNLYLALSHFSNCGFMCYFGLFSRAGQIDVQGHLAEFLTPRFDKAVFLGRYFSQTLSILLGIGFHLKKKY